MQLANSGSWTRSPLEPSRESHWPFDGLASIEGCEPQQLVRVRVAQGSLDQARRLAIECLPLMRDEKVGVDLLEATGGLGSNLGAHEMSARFWGAADPKLYEWGCRHWPVDVDHTAPHR